MTDAYRAEARMALEAAEAAAAAKATGAAKAVESKASAERKALRKAARYLAATFGIGAAAGVPLQQAEALLRSNKVTRPQLEGLITLLSNKKETVASKKVDDPDNPGQKISINLMPELRNKGCTWLKKW